MNAQKRTLARPNIKAALIQILPKQKAPWDAQAACLLSGRFGDKVSQQYTSSYATGLTSDEVFERLNNSGFNYARSTVSMSLSNLCRGGDKTIQQMPGLLPNGQTTLGFYLFYQI